MMSPSKAQGIKLVQSERAFSLVGLRRMGKVVAGMLLLIVWSSY